MFVPKPLEMFYSINLSSFKVYNWQNYFFENGHFLVLRLHDDNPKRFF